MERRGRRRLSQWGPPPQKAIPPIVSITVFKQNERVLDPCRNPKDAGEGTAGGWGGSAFHPFQAPKASKRGAVLALVARLRGRNGEDEGGSAQWDPAHKRPFPPLFPLRFSSKTSGFLGSWAGMEGGPSGSAFRDFQAAKAEEPRWPWLPGCEDGPERTKAGAVESPPAAAPRFVLFKPRKTQNQEPCCRAGLGCEDVRKGEDEAGSPQWGLPYKRQFPQLFPLRLSSKTSEG